jgi:hypothetical protein
MQSSLLDTIRNYNIATTPKIHDHLTEPKIHNEVPPHFEVRISFRNRNFVQIGAIERPWAQFLNAGWKAD